MRTLGFISLVAASGHHRTRPKEVRGPKPPYIIKDAAKKAKDAEKKLARDLAAMNKPAKKVPHKKPASATKIVKTTSLIIPIQQRLSPLSRLGTRKPKSRVLVVPLEQVSSAGVAVAKTASRSINLPQRFR